MKHRNSTYKIIIILITTVSALLFVTKDSYASNPSVVGFIIEVSQMEGTLQTPAMSVGNTSTEKSRSMLNLTFDNLTCKDLVIKKMVKTSKGIITTRMTSNDKILFKNLSLSVTNAEYSEIYVPESGNIGLKNAKLLAHNVKTVSSSLPQFQLSFNEGGEVELAPKSEAELLQMKAGLEYFLSNNQQ